MNDTLSLLQIDSLRTLANNCPMQDGEGVYRARAILSDYDTAGTVYDEQLYCTVNGRQPHKLVKNKKDSANTTSDIPNSEFNLYPNPNNGGFTLSYELQNGQSGEFIIYNMVGEKMASYPLDINTDKMLINETSLDNGVYLYKIIVNDNPVKEDKLVIIK